jgi:hypothetical protein
LFSLWNTNSNSSFFIGEVILKGGENMNKQFKYLILTSFVAIVVLVLGLLFYRQPNDQISQEYRDSYMNGCNDTGTNYNYCICTLNYLDKNFTNDEILKMSIEITDTSAMSKGMIDAVTACIYLYVD